MSALRVVYFGTPDFSAEFLRALISDADFDVVALVAQPDEPVGRKQILTAPATKTAFIEKYPERPVFQPSNLKADEFVAALSELKADYFVIVAYGRIIPANILALPQLGPVNVHPSLLPLYRGPSPMQAAIANGDSETGISIMLIDAEMDHGPLLAQSRFPLTSDVTLPTLSAEVARDGSMLLLKTLKDFAAGNITPVAQEHDHATYCKLLSKDDGRVSAVVHDAASIERKVRAYAPWPGVTISLETDKGLLATKILRAELSNETVAVGAVINHKDHFTFGTTNGALAVFELQPAGGKPMKAEDFLRGYAVKLAL